MPNTYLLRPVEACCNCWFLLTTQCFHALTPYVYFSTILASGGGWLITGVGAGSGWWSSCTHNWTKIITCRYSLITRDRKIHLYYCQTVTCLTLLLRLLPLLLFPAPRLFFAWDRGTAVNTSVSAAIVTKFYRLYWLDSICNVYSINVKFWNYLRLILSISYLIERLTWIDCWRINRVLQIKCLIWHLLRHTESHLQHIFTKLTTLHGVVLSVFFGLWLYTFAIWYDYKVYYATKNSTTW